MRRYVWAPFAVALTAFALPFATVSCGGSRVDASGADFVLRGEPEAAAGGSDIAPFVIVYGGGLVSTAFVIFALALIVTRNPWSLGWAAVAGATGVGALVVLKLRDSGEPDVAESTITIDARYGAIIAATPGDSARSRLRPSGSGKRGVRGCGRSRRPSAPRCCSSGESRRHKSVRRRARVVRAGARARGALPPDR